MEHEFGLLDWCSANAARRWENGIAVSGRAAIEGGTKRQAEGRGMGGRGQARENMAAGASPFGVRGEKKSDFVRTLRV